MGSVDAIDHSTVRHEMAHVLQHCVNVQRGTDRDTPIINDIDELAELVNTNVSSDTVDFIKSAYPREKWLVEFEANYVENTYTADQLVDLFYEFDCQYLFQMNYIQLMTEAAEARTREQASLILKEAEAAQQEAQETFEKASKG